MSGIISIQQDPVINVINYGSTAVTLYKNANIASCKSYFENNSAAPA